MNKHLNSRRTRAQQKKSSPPVWDENHSKKAMVVAVKIAINGILSTAAITALVRLVPYHFSQEAKLEEITVEVRNAEKRVAKLRESFSKNFATSFSDSTMENYSSKVEPNQVRVFWQPSSEKNN